MAKHAPSRTTTALAAVLATACTSPTHDNLHGSQEQNIRIGGLVLNPVSFEIKVLAVAYEIEAALEKGDNYNVHTEELKTLAKAYQQFSPEAIESIDKRIHGWAQQTTNRPHLDKAMVIIQEIFDKEKFRQASPVR